MAALILDSHVRTTYMFVQEEIAVIPPFIELFASKYLQEGPDTYCAQALSGAKRPFLAIFIPERTVCFPPNSGNLEVYDRMTGSRRNQSNGDGIVERA